MFWAIASIVLGLGLLWAGGEGLVRGAASLATRLKIAPLVIGLVVVGFGTSTPELVVSLKAALNNASDIAVGNVVGSNIANILLILGLSAIITPIVFPFSKARRDIIVMLACSAFLLLMAQTGKISWQVGLAFVTGLILYISLLARFKQGADEEHDDEISILPKKWLDGVYIALGLTGLLLGAQLLVSGAINIARFYNVSEAAIGLTVVAVGTSLPELAASLVAAFKRQADLAMGNIIGSNIFNIAGILGFTALLTPLQVSSNIVEIDIPFMLLVAVVLAVSLKFFNGIPRLLGTAYLSAYMGYVVWQF